MALHFLIIMGARACDAPLSEAYAVAASGALA